MYKTKEIMVVYPLQPDIDKIVEIIKILNEKYKNDPKIMAKCFSAAFCNKSIKSNGRVQIIYGHWLIVSTSYYVMDYKDFQELCEFIQDEYSELGIRFVTTGDMDYVRYRVYETSQPIYRK